MTTRRSFIKKSALTGAAALTLPGIGFAGTVKNENMTELYELRTYYLKNETQQQLVEDYYREAFIPAVNRLGIKPVGVFTELKPEGQTKLYVLIPFSSVDDFLSFPSNLGKDRDYKIQGSAYLDAPASEPAYERIESSLLGAFAHFPKLALPGQQPRIFELRLYESATENAGKKKISMFNDEGEIDIFKKLGFRPVFFAETLIGPLRPNLIYMLTFDDMAAHDSHWKAFGSDPEWKKISSVPDFSDAKLVSKIISRFIIPTAYSQI